jgi:CubicO group peptidase (beta-lactamase class C family)
MSSSYHQKLESTIPSSPPTTGPANSLPSIVLLGASTSSPDHAYKYVRGHTSLLPDKARPVTEDSLFWIASCTKLLTSLCILQLVEQGKIELDQAVGDILPELARPEILEGFDPDGKPRLKAATRKIEVRHLTTHTSGMAYGFLSEEIMAWQKSQGIEQKDIDGDIIKSYSSPLLFEPGTQWMYSPGLDWAGLLIARVAGEKDLGTYMEKHLWGPLGIKKGDMAFRLDDLGLSQADLDERLVGISLRKQGDGSLVPLPTTGPGSFRGLNPKDCLGGGGIIATPAAYLKVLDSLLRNDGKIVKPETLDKYMLEPQLVADKIGTGAYESLMKTFDTMVGSKMLTGGLPLPNEEGAHEYQHGLLGLLDREKGGKSDQEWTLTWGGLPNLFWHVNRTDGVAGM